MWWFLRKGTLAIADLFLISYVFLWLNLLLNFLAGNVQSRESRFIHNHQLWLLWVPCRVMEIQSVYDVFIYLHRRNIFSRLFRHLPRLGHITTLLEIALPAMVFFPTFEGFRFGPHFYWLCQVAPRAIEDMKFLKRLWDKRDLSIFLETQLSRLSPDLERIYEGIEALENFETLVPENYLCPIYFKIMRAPTELTIYDQGEVRSRRSYSRNYDGFFLQAWLRRSTVDPLTNVQLINRNYLIRANAALNQEIQARISSINSARLALSLGSEVLGHRSVRAFEAGEESENI